MKPSERTRDSRGRFVKESEVCAGAEEQTDKAADTLRRYGQEAADRLRAIADDPDTPVKLKADIERLFFEAVYGKGGKLAENEGGKAPAVIKFEGELEEWSK